MSLNDNDDVEVGEETQNFRIQESFRRFVKIFQMEEILYLITFSDINQSFEEANNKIHQIFDDLLERILKLTEPQDKISINIIWFGNSLNI